MITKTKTGLYTTETITYSKKVRVNVFNTKEEAIKSLNMINRLKYKIMRVRRDHGMLIGLGLAYEKSELVILLPFTVITISKKQ